MNQINTILGAVLNALISFTGSIVTLFANDVALEFNLIATAAWVSMAGTAMLSFFKDYKAITTRRFFNKATESGDGGGTV